MVGAFLVMSSIQISWLRSSIRMKQQLFDASVHQALTEVSELVTQPSMEILTMELEAMSSPNPKSHSNSSPIGQGIDVLERRMLARMDAFELGDMINNVLENRGVLAEAWVAVFDRYGQPV